MSPVALLFAAAVVAGDPGTATAPAPKSPKVALETSKGKIVLELDAERAPKSVENFLAYVRAGHYDGTVFHRVIAGFMIQGGGFDEKMSQRGTRPSIENEADNGLKNKRGTVAMARTNDPHSASAQFFVNTVDNGFLDHQSKDARGWGYAVFGRVVEGMDVVDAIAKVATGNRGPFQDVPLEAVVIRKASVVE
jgi:cyclophilin family peptidyl-prolyl cis-trans isomerase